MLFRLLKNRWIVWPCVLLSVLLIFLFYYHINPVKTDMGTLCSFKTLTGLNCAGCGGQRAFHFLLHGEFLQALRYNFLIFFLPFFLYLIYLIVEVYIFKEKKHLHGFMFSNKLGIIVVTVVILYTVLRNLPYEPFIYLAPPK
jgi:hypothetical protein